jgi:ribose-phosphate pyrophosphokinase
MSEALHEVPERVIGRQLPDEIRDSVVLVSGGVYPEFAQRMAKILGIELAETELRPHANSEGYSRVLNNMRGRSVYIYQAHQNRNGYKIRESEDEHKSLILSASNADAAEVTGMAPYMINSRGDRKSKSREAEMMKKTIMEFEACGADRLISMDLHSQQTIGFFRGRKSYEHLIAGPELRYAIARDMGKAALKDVIFVAPDAGATKLNEKHSEKLSEFIYGEDSDEGLPPPLWMPKVRSREDSTKLKRYGTLDGVEGRIVIMVDDIIDSGGTMMSAAENLKNAGASEVVVAATHGFFTKDAPRKFAKSAIDRVYITDTVSVDEPKKVMKEKLHIVPVDEVNSRAIYEIETNGSISNIFDDQHFS